MVFFETKAKISLDPIVGLVQKASEDSSPDKLLAIVGSAMDDSGKLIVPNAVNDAAKELVEAGLSMGYAPSGGIKDLAPMISQEFIGKDTLKDLYDENIRRAEVITCGGTNAISATLMTCTKPSDPIILQRPHWAGYDSISLGIGRANIYNFELLKENDEFNLENFSKTVDRAVKALPKEANSKVTLILNTPYDNPLGKDLGADVWEQIANVLASYKGQEFLIILDIAYIDFGPNAKDYSKLAFLKDFFKKVNSEKLSVVVAGTLSKSFAMYGARVGVATLLSSSYENVSNWKDAVGGTLRGTVSNLSKTSQEIAFKILTDEAKLANVHQFQKDTVALIEKRKEHFLNTITPNLPEELALIKPDGGFFVSFKIKDEVLERVPDIGARLSETFIRSSTYIPVLLDQYLRIPVCGLSEAKLDQVTERLLKYTQEVLAPV
ncbi:MAG: pyridoxal phosphate-dependent aminotransferase [Candidatus Caenarcaniphilales bacterium]|nr:pyridoxal phosphate-dependent aminotransferase [Candidatus Caenarcaniphilales bacterium]